MHRTSIALLVAIGTCSSLAYAAPIGWEPVGSGESDSSQDRYYESSSGNQYQYNLDKPTDRIRYEHDAPAQLRDRYDPRTQIDRSTGQYGGGIYND